MGRIDRSRGSFLILWVVVQRPFLVGGVTCLVNSVNERDLNLVTSCAVPERNVLQLLRGTVGSSQRKFEAITGL